MGAVDFLQTHDIKRFFALATGFPVRAKRVTRAQRTDRARPTHVERGVRGIELRLEGRRARGEGDRATA
jgi:hypothetical protein